MFLLPASNFIMSAAITEELRAVEYELRNEWGVERFDIGKKTVHCRTSGGNGSQDFGEDGPRKKVDRITVTAFKDEWAGNPFAGQAVVWHRGDEKIKMKVDTFSGHQVSSPTWSISLVSL